MQFEGSTVLKILCESRPSSLRWFKVLEVQTGPPTLMRMVWSVNILAFKRLHILVLFSRGFQLVTRPGAFLNEFISLHCKLK